MLRARPASSAYVTLKGRLPSMLQMSEICQCRSWKLTLLSAFPVAAGDLLADVQAAAVARGPDAIVRICGAS